MTTIAEFVAEIGLVGDISKLEKVEKSFANLYNLASKNSKNISKVFQDFDKKTKDIAKNSKKTSTNIDNVENKSKSVSSSFSSIGLKVAALPAALGASYWALDRIVKKSSQLSLDVRNVGLETGLNRTKMMEWQQVAQIANPNMNASQVLGTIATIQKGIADIRLGSGNVGPYQLLGMTLINQDAFGVLEQLRKKSKEFSKDKRSWFTSLVQQMGIPPAMIAALRMSDKTFAKYKKIPFLSEENQNALVTMRQNFKLLNIEVGALWDTFMADISPSLIKLAHFLDKIMREMFGYLNYIKKNKPIGALSPPFGLIGYFKSVHDKEAKAKMEKSLTQPAGFHGMMRGLYSQLPDTSNTSNINNTFNITGENDLSLAHKLKDIIQPQHEHTYSQQNNGPRR